MTSMPTYCIFGYLANKADCLHKPTHACAYIFWQGCSAVVLDMPLNVKSSVALNGTSMSIRPIVYLDNFDSATCQTSKPSCFPKDTPSHVQLLRLMAAQLHHGSVSAHQGAVARHPVVREMRWQTGSKRLGGCALPIRSQAPVRPQRVHTTKQNAQSPRTHAYAHKQT